MVSGQRSGLGIGGLLLGLLLLASSCGGDDAPGGAGRAPVQSRPAVSVQPSVPLVAEIAVAVNGEEFARLPDGVPLLLRVVVRNRHESATLDLTRADLLPRVVGADGRLAQAAIEALGDAPGSVAPGEQLTAYWSAAGLSPGAYEISIGFEVDAFAGRVHATTARLEIDDEAAPELAAHYERRLLAMRDPVAWVEALRSASDAAPDDPGLRLQLSDALWAQGDIQGSEAELRRLLAATDDELPHALLWRLERLAAQERE